jgi:hypothetical protein
VGGGFFTQEAWKRALKADYVFRGIDKYTASFLSSSLNVKVAVQFGCFRLATPYEDALVEALETGSPEIKLQALAILLRVSAPSSVPLQWKVLAELRNLDPR